ncbi:MAG TPA: pentapeptide repeat-containing protein [Candidatus Limnocylindrales bacterium]|nr:pentapeptide repeat-containing protein [Candidatus Limnocylindrales bacterium]
MIEAVVGVALRAILASVVLGGVLAALVLVATRTLNLTASSRHALWTTALLATALMPLAGIGVSIARATAAAPAATTSAPAPDAAPATGAATLAAPARSAAETTAMQRRAARHEVRGTGAAPQRLSAAANRAAYQPIALGGPSLLDRLPVIRWTPRMSRNLAIGVVGVWVLGALIGLIGLAASIARVRGLKRRSSPLDGTLADELPWLTEIGPGREIYLRLSFEIETPVAIGFRRPVILIPTELATADGLAAIEQLVLHEHAHLRRYDDWTNLVQRVIERIFWFNPIVWMVGRRIALEREIASDDAVVEKTGEAHAYATSLWRLAREMRMPEHAVVAPGALLTRKQITVRIEQLLDKKRARLHRSPLAALGVAVASVLAVAVVATSAPAVELPAVAEAPAGAATVNAAAPVTWHAAAVRSAHTKISHPASSAVARGNQQTDLRASDTRQVAVLEPKTVNFQLVPMPTVAPRSHESPSRGSKYAGEASASQSTGSRSLASHDASAHDALTARGTTVSTGSGTVAPPPPAPPGANAGVPVAPSIPELPPNGTRYVIFPHDVPPLTPQQIAKLTSAAENALARAKRTHETVEIGPEVAKAMKIAMGSMPAQIAQESTWSNRTRVAGVKLSRELVASCMACSLHGADLRNVDLHGLKINGDDLSGADLRGANLSGAQLLGVSLRGANLSGADLRNAELNGVDLREANFDNAQLDGIKLIGASVQHVSLRGTTLRSLIASCTGCDFAKLDLHGQDLHGLLLNGANFNDADLRGVNFSGAQLTGVSLARANLMRADLRNAQLNGTEMRNANLDGANLEGIRLNGVSVRSMSLRGTALRSVLANCTGCDLSHLDLHGQDLHGITLSGADLSHSDLREANLSGVRFSGVDLTGSNLSGANLTNARFEGCNLAGVELHGAHTAGMTMTGSSGLDG